jgi:hypothetical protein
VVVRFSIDHMHAARRMVTFTTLVPDQAILHPAKPGCTSALGMYNAKGLGSMNNRSAIWGSVLLKLIHPVCLCHGRIRSPGGSLGSKLHVLSRG